VTAELQFLRDFYIRGFVHRNCIFIRSNKMQQYAGIYLLQSHPTRFGCPSHRSSGVHKTVTAASGTGHSICATTFFQHGQIWTCTPDDGCDVKPETCRVILQFLRDEHGFLNRTDNS
jgi:hypothetical protein